MRAQPLVLIIEDDEAISNMLDRFLLQHDYKTYIAKSSQEAIPLFRTHGPDLVLLDLGLPDADGKTIIKKIRSEISVPIIVISARHDEKEVIASLDAGADDYVTKPFSLDELYARIRSAQRRFLGLQPSINALHCHELMLDVAAHTVTKNGTMLKVTPTEFHLLKYFMAHRNHLLPYARILKEVWGVGYQNEIKTLRTYINNLRKKIEIDPARPVFIRTEMGIGYRFVCESSAVLARSPDAHA